MSGARMLGSWLAATLALCACEAADRTSAPEVKPQAVVSSTNAPQAIAFPELSGRVVDQADLLGSEAEARLTEALAELERRTSDQMVIVTIPSLAGRPIEDYARELGNHWGLGSAGKANGVLLVVAPRERRVRIAVGRGLEPVLTNVRAAEIIERDLLPAFRESRWEAGVAAGTSSIVRALTEGAAEPRPGRP